VAAVCSTSSLQQNPEIVDQINLDCIVTMILNPNNSLKTKLKTFKIKNSYSNSIIGDSSAAAFADGGRVLEHAPRGGERVNEDFASMRRQQMRHDLAPGAPRHLQHHGTPAEQEVDEARGRATVDVHRSDPLHHGAVLQFNGRAAAGSAPLQGHRLVVRAFAQRSNHGRVKRAYKQQICKINISFL